MSSAVAIAEDRRARSEALWDRVEREYYDRSEAEETARVRRLMLLATLAELRKRVELSHDVAALLGELLTEIENLSELSELIACALARAEDRAR